MTRDDIIRMAEEAGVYATTSMGVTRYEALPDELAKFAQLVAAHEREQIAKFLEETLYVNTSGTHAGEARVSLLEHHAKTLASGIRRRK